MKARARKRQSQLQLLPVGFLEALVGQLHLPDLRDANRNFAIKKLAEELASEDTLSKVKESDPESKMLCPIELSKFVVELENGIRLV